MKISLNVIQTQASPYFWVAEIGRARFGFHQSDGWCMQMNDKISFIDSEDRCDPLLPVLELDKHVFFEHLQNIASSNEELSSAMAAFPEELLLKHAFHSSFSGYWPERALAWLAENAVLQPAFKSELTRFADNVVLPQQARQKARKILKSLQ